MDTTLSMRLERRSRRRGECLEWFGTTTRGGYGLIRNGEKNVLTHRAAWQLKNGAIPDGLRVLHKCDNPPCINPDHLFLGTQSDNMLDMAKKGRHRSKTAPDSVQRGERHYAAKLSTRSAEEIRFRKSAGESQRSIAISLGISEATVSLVVNGKRWFKAQHPTASK